jgi:hypothetical protein
MVNLQGALFPILQDRTFAQLTAALVFVALLALWLIAVRRGPRLGLLDLAILTSASLLPVYHRFTDAGLLLVAMVWALSEMKGKRISAIACLLLAVHSWFPALLFFMNMPGRMRFSMRSHTRYWEWSILPHEAWLILVICAVLVTARFRPSAISADQSS